MSNIIIGTTPTIKYKFNEIEVAWIVSAYLTIKKDNEIIIMYPLADAEVGTDYLSWTLSQEDTLAIGVGPARVMLNWVLGDGTRGASNEAEFRMRGNHIQEVI